MRFCTALLTGALALVVLFGGLRLGGEPARAANGPLSVTITGDPVVGRTLTATATYTDTTAPVVVTFVWQRCTPDLSSCSDVAETDNVSMQSGPSGQSAANDYLLVPADAGSRIQVQVTLVAASGVSMASADVAVQPSPTPTPTPTPTPAATPTPSSTPTPPRPTVVPSPPIAPTPPSRPPRRRALRQLRPFPIVRIKGFLTGDGAYITLLTVRAPRLAHIVIRCRGEGCPKRRWAHAVALVHARRFERRLLPAGVRLKITVTRRGYIGKYALIRLRRGRPPWRRDRCLFPGSSRPRACPANL